MQAVPELDESVPTLILYGDVPLIGIESLRRLVSVAGNERLGILTVEMPDPTGYGRLFVWMGESDGLSNKRMVVRKNWP